MAVYCVTHLGSCFPANGTGAGTGVLRKFSLKFIDR